MQTGPAQLIVLEGPDGVGKSTISFALYEKLTDSSLECEYFSFPGKENETIGRLVHDLHHEPSMFGLESLSPASLQTLHIAAHLDVIEQRIRPAINDGKWVVLDRFWWSTWVYGRASGIDENMLDALIQPERIQWQGAKPLVLFLIDRSPDSSGRNDQANIREGYEALFKEEHSQYPVYQIKNDGSVQEALNEILEVLRDVMSRSLDSATKSRNVDFNSEVTQLSIPLPDEAPSSVFTKLSPAVPTVVYDSYWRFAVERQEVFFRKIDGRPSPWTNDEILRRHKFTNAYRASDRVSQYLIQHVIYEGEKTPEEVFFRTILFKLFNKIETWKLLSAKLGTVSYADYSFSKYDEILARSLSSGTPIYSAAYIMPSGKTSFGHSQKHRNHLLLLEQMMEDGVPRKIGEAVNMRQAFELLRSYSTVGSFLAYQFVTDLNYSAITDFSEMEFVIPGPGALDGIHKCFTDFGGLNEQDIIRIVTDRQEREFERLGLRFRSLWGRRLQLIDCQNLFCEVSKYARLKHPEIPGVSNRTRIKQIYRPSEDPIRYWYPPKWRINHRIRQISR